MREKTQKMRRNYNKVATRGSRDGEMMKQEPTLEQRALQILKVPSLSKPIQEAKHNPPHAPASVISCPHAAFYLQRKVNFETR